jgi:hypothetical protein
MWSPGSSLFEDLKKIKFSGYNSRLDNCTPAWLDGGIAQLGERLHGMQEVSGSIPLTSTKVCREEFEVRREFVSSQKPVRKFQGFDPIV